MSGKLNPTEANYYKSRLQRRVSIQEVESRTFGRPSPENPGWRKFLEQMLEIDELWQYSSSKEEWENCAGEVRAAIVRNGEVIDIFTLLHN